MGLVNVQHNGYGHGIVRLKRSHSWIRSLSCSSSENGIRREKRGPGGPGKDSSRGWEAF